MNTSRKEEDAQGVVGSGTEPTIVEAQTICGDRQHEVSCLDGVRAAVVIHRRSGERGVVKASDG